MAAIATLTDNASRILAGWADSNDAKEKAVMALMAIEWAADLTRAIGRERLNRFPGAMGGRAIYHRANTRYSEIFAYTLRTNLPRSIIRNGPHGID